MYYWSISCLKENLAININTDRQFSRRCGRTITKTETEIEMKCSESFATDVWRGDFLSFRTDIWKIHGRHSMLAFWTVERTKTKKKHILCVTRLPYASRIHCPFPLTPNAKRLNVVLGLQRLWLFFCNVWLCVREHFNIFGSDVICSFVYSPMSFLSVPGLLDWHLFAERDTTMRRAESSFLEIIIVRCIRLYVCTHTRHGWINNRINHAFPFIDFRFPFVISPSIEICQKYNSFRFLLIAISICPVMTWRHTHKSPVTNSRRKSSPMWCFYHVLIFVCNDFSTGHLCWRVVKWTKKNGRKVLPSIQLSPFMSSLYRCSSSSV